MNPSRKRTRNAKRRTFDSEHSSQLQQGCGIDASYSLYHADEQGQELVPHGYCHSQRGIFHRHTANPDTWLVMDKDRFRVMYCVQRFQPQAKQGWACPAPNLGTNRLLAWISVTVSRG